MTRGDVNYAKTADGAHIAYQIVGAGPFDLLLPPHLVPIDAVWDDPELAGALERLATFSRVILLDRRGTGASDALFERRLPTAEESMAELTAVMDAAGSERAAVVASDNPGPALMVAATQPERVTALVLVNAFVRLARSDDYPMGISESMQASFFETLDTWELDSSVALIGGSRGEDPSFRRWLIATLRRSGTPGAFEAILRYDLSCDVRDLLPHVQVPTLVLHSSDNRYLPVDHGKYLAQHIPGARFVELHGSGHNIAAIDLDRFVEEIADFLTGVRPQPRTSRVFAAVMITDIVDSTPKAGTLGDRRWKSLLDEHDRIVSRQLHRFGGRLVKSTGDGVVATFDGPARAIACAQAVRDGLRSLDLGVRIGMHAGEIEPRGEDVSGIAIHVASRVEAKAAEGEIIVSRTMVDLVAGSGITFEDRGEHELKGVPGLWRLFAVTAA